MGKKKKKTAQPNTAAVYARYSSDNQRDASIDAQIRACSEFAKNKGLTIIKTYADRAKSGTSADREQFQQMIKDSGEGIFHHIIVHKLDRFSRDKYDSAIYKRELKLNGVTIQSVIENLDGSPESIMMETIYEGFAQYFSANLSREVMKGLKENAYNCIHTGGFAPLGYDVHPETKKYVINVEEAKTVRKIFEMYTAGYGYKQIMEYLNSMGYKTKFGKPFGSNSLHTILRNEKYTGTFVYNKKLEKGVDGRRRPSYKAEEEVIRVPNGMPAIIDRAAFDKAQILLDRNNINGGRFKAKEIYLLSGIVFCGECGSALYGNCRYCGRGKTKYVTYRCSNRSQHKGCKNKEMNKLYLENYVLDELYRKLFNEKSITKLQKMLTDYSQKNADQNHDELLTATEQLQSAEKEINGIIDLVSQSGISVATVGSRLRELEGKKEYLEGYIKELTTNERLQITEEMIVSLINRSKDFIRTKNVAECRMFIDSYIEKVLLYHDHAEVYYKINVLNEHGELALLKSTVDTSALLRDYKNAI